MKIKTEKNVKPFIKLEIKNENFFSVSSQEVLLVIVVEVFECKMILFGKTRG